MNQPESRYGDLLGELDDIADDTYEGRGSPQLCGRAASAIRQLLSEVRYTQSETGPSVEQYRQAVEKTVQLRLALQQCVAVAEMWHGDEAFDLYYNHSPEMKLIRDALGKIPAPTDAPSERSERTR